MYCRFRTTISTILSFQNSEAVRIGVTTKMENLKFSMINVWNNVRPLPFHMMEVTQAAAKVRCVPHLERRHVVRAGASGLLRKLLHRTRPANTHSKFLNDLTVDVLPSGWRARAIAW